MTDRNKQKTRLRLVEHTENTSPELEQMHVITVVPGSMVRYKAVGKLYLGVIMSQGLVAPVVGGDYMFRICVWGSGTPDEGLWISPGDIIPEIREGGA